MHVYVPEASYDNRRFSLLGGQREHVTGEAMEQVIGMSTFGRLIEPSEIADALLWAARSPVINGSVIHANLGQIET